MHTKFWLENVESRPLGRRRPGWEDRIRYGSKEIGLEVVE